MAPLETPEEREAAIRAELDAQYENRKWWGGLWSRLNRLGKWIAIAAGALALGHDAIARIGAIWASLWK